LDDQDALVQALSFLCLQTYLQGDFQATVHYAQEGVTVARAVQDDFNELRIQAFLCQGEWSTGNYTTALSLLREGLTQAEERGNRFVQGRLLNTLGWFHHELCDFASAVTFNRQSVEVGRASGIDNVEISALINLGYDYLALGEQSQALACLEPTLARVEREGFGAHRWRWQMKLYLGLAEHAYGTGACDQALHYVDTGLAEALATSSQKYVAKGRALRGKILLQLGQLEAAGAEFKRAFSLAESLHSPALAYPLAYALGQWYAMKGKEREAVTLVGRCKAIVEQMAAALGDEGLARVFLHSEPVRRIFEN
jgi:tetratricopeptide (TPR) repeat protein